MAVRKMFLGSLGPFYYDDTDLPNDPDGDFGGQTQSAVLSNGQIVIQQAPVQSEEVARKQEIDIVTLPAIAVTDLDDPSAELASISGLQIGVLLVAYESIANAADPFTLYCWDANIDSANTPYIVTGADSGFWVAVAGKYNNLFKTVTQTVITAIQDNAGTIEYKTRDLTFQGTLGTESDWIST